MTGGLSRIGEPKVASPPSTQGAKATGERYLPAKAIKSLSDSEYAASTRAKRRGTAKGKQFVAQPKKVAKKVKSYRS